MKSKILLKREGKLKMKKALLIGIDKYNQNVYNLNGCINDIKGMRDILKQNKYDVSLLSDKEASASNTKQEIHDFLKNNTGELLIYYAGHGSQIVDKNGDEADGMDEVICLCDYPTGVIIDDDLYNLFSSKDSKSNLTVIFDCCHSGTAMRSVDTIRFIQPDFTPATPGKQFKELALAIPNFTFLSACGDGETAKEISVDGTIRGAFSYAFQNAIKEAGMRDWKSLVNEIQTFLDENNIDQHPEMHVGASTEEDLEFVPPEAVDSLFPNIPEGLPQEAPANVPFPFSQNIINEAFAKHILQYHSNKTSAPDENPITKPIELEKGIVFGICTNKGEPITKGCFVDFEGLKTKVKVNVDGTYIFNYLAGELECSLFYKDKKVESQKVIVSAGSSVQLDWIYT